MGTLSYQSIDCIGEESGETKGKRKNHEVQVKYCCPSQEIKISWKSMSVALS